MNNRLAAALATIGLGTLVACSDRDPVAPTTNAPLAMSADASSGGRYVVVFKNKVPESFANLVSGLGGTVDASYETIGVAVASGLSHDAAVAVGASSDVEQIMADELIQLIDPVGSQETEAANDVTPASPLAPNTAVFYPRQWHLRQIGAHTAWAAGKLGSPEVKVAILDTGIDYLHADLAGRVDLASSASFVPTDDAIVAALFPARHPVTDLHYHGTHVAATVASNALAAAGVTSMTTLIGVKVLNVNGSGATSGVLAGIVHAADRANIINMSLGNQGLPFDMKDKETKDFFNKVVDRAFKYAHSKGVTVIVAAGNQAQNLDVPHTYKPYCGAKHAICVSATGPTASSGVNGPWVNPDAFAAYSNFGLKKVDLAAPGGTSPGVVWAACSGTSLQVPVCQTGTFVLGLGGTSMATPHVSGLAALLMADKNGVGGGYIRSRMENTAVDLGDPGEDALFGRGRISVPAALGL